MIRSAASLSPSRNAVHYFSSRKLSTILYQNHYPCYYLPGIYNSSTRNQLMLFLPKKLLPSPFFQRKYSKIAYVDYSGEVGCLACEQISEVHLWVGLSAGIHAAQKCNCCGKLFEHEDIDYKELCEPKTCYCGHYIERKTEKQCCMCGCSKETHKKKQSKVKLTNLFEAPMSTMTKHVPRNKWGIT